MANDYTAGYPLDYRQGGDKVDDFAQKYMAEIDRLYKIIFALATGNTADGVSPVANQIKVTNGVMYIRDIDNKEWITLGDVTKPYFGFKASENDTVVTSAELPNSKVADINAIDFNKIVTTDALPTSKINDVNGIVFSKIVTTDQLSAAKIANVNSFDFSKAVTTDMLSNAKIASINNADIDNMLTTSDIATGDKEANKLYRTNANGLLPVSILGNAGKLGDVAVELNDIKDGQVITYSAATNTWRNRDKGVIGAGKALTVYRGDDLEVEYSGDTEERLVLLFKKLPNGNITFA